MKIQQHNNSLAQANSTFNTVMLFGLISLMLLVLTTNNANAQGALGGRGGYNDQYYGGNEVVMYSECGFRGKATAVRVGEHSKIQNLGFPNDDLSSLRVPNGLEVIIYEDSKFRGASARIDQDIDCFDRSWDNAASSIRVNRVGGSVSRPGFPRNDQIAPRVNTKNIAYVTFSNSELRRGNGNTWYLGARGQTNSLSEFRVINDDGSSLFLDNPTSRERLRIDLNARQVVYFTSNGLTQAYPIQQAQPGPVQSFDRPHNNTQRPTANSEPSRRISGQCFDYRAYARGGDGGLRFHGKNNVEKFTSRPVTGRVCHSGALTMEITKTNPSTEVVVEIQGRKFVFGRNEPETRFENNWYRKDVRLVVGN